MTYRTKSGLLSIPSYVTHHTSPHPHKPERTQSLFLPQMQKDSSSDTSSPPTPSYLVSSDSGTHSLYSRSPIYTTTWPVMSQGSSPFTSYSRPLHTFQNTPATSHPSIGSHSHRPLVPFHQNVTHRPKTFTTSYFRTFGMYFCYCMRISKFPIYSAPPLLLYFWYSKTWAHKW